jgi:hypothetical protein
MVDVGTERRQPRQVVALVVLGLDGSLLAEVEQPDLRSPQVIDLPQLGLAHRAVDAAAQLVQHDGVSGALGVRQRLELDGLGALQERAQLGAIGFDGVQRNVRQLVVVARDAELRRGGRGSTQLGLPNVIGQAGQLRRGAVRRRARLGRGLLPAATGNGERENDCTTYARHSGGL